MRATSAASCTRSSTGHGTGPVSWISSAAALPSGERKVVGLCNKAGFGNLGNFVDNDPEAETAVVRLNIEALHELTGAFLPRMVEQGAGAILNVASTAAFQPLPGFATYAAS